MFINKRQNNRSRKNCTKFNIVFMTPSHQLMNLLAKSQLWAIMQISEFLKHLYIYFNIIIIQTLQRTMIQYYLLKFR